MVPLTVLRDATLHFLECFGEMPLVGHAFSEIIGDGDGGTRFARLLSATGYEGDAEGLLGELTRRLSRVKACDHEPVTINGVLFPQPLLLWLMERILPGHGCVSVKDVGRLERLTHVTVKKEEREDLQKVMDRYPVRLSMHALRQMMISENVARQYLPFVEELDPEGYVHTWIGQFQDGLLERMYPNRVIFLLNMSCPVYCRFCFRKHKESRNGDRPTPQDVDRAVDYVAGDPSIKEVLITGGDPFLNRAGMQTAIDRLMAVPHIQNLRLATRSISYYPQLFYADGGFWLNYVKQKGLELRQKGKYMEVATHFIHPDEVSPESLEIISTLKKNGISVYIQTPFLRGCNDKGPELVRLFNILRGAGAEIHYIFTPCEPIRGSGVYWTHLSEGVDIAAELRARLSDRGMPKICTSTPIGKIDWYSSGWAVEPVQEEGRFLWLRTPYDAAYHETFAPGTDLRGRVRVNEEGTLDIRFMAEVRNESLYLGSREAHRPNQVAPPPEALKEVQAEGLKDRRIAQTIAATGSPTLFRLHETRAAMDVEGSERDIEYIRKDRRITDVVLASTQDAVECLDRIAAIIKRLKDIHHVHAVRLRSRMFNLAPEKYTRGMIDKLGELNKLTVVNPLRLEIETEFLHSSEFRPVHGELCKALHAKGVTVYSNTPLLGTINDAPDEVSRIAYKTREIGMEFHHVYLAGHPLQRKWNDAHPIDVADVIDIGTRVRRNGSGREIPRYIILTELGEVDFGLTSRLLGGKGRLWVKLLPYDEDYFKSMDPHFALPEGVRTDEDGRFIVPVSGMRATSDFMVSPYLHLVETPG
ncbi:MAG: radical SAM protein [Desulfatiglandales bacterium]